MGSESLWGRAPSSAPQPTTTWRSPMTPVVAARALTKSYGKTRALAGLDLTVEPGEVVALLGPNGAGKTTFVRTVATLRPPRRRIAARRRVRRDPPARPGARPDRAGRTDRRRRGRAHRPREPRHGRPPLRARPGRGPPPGGRGARPDSGWTSWPTDRPARTRAAMRRRLDLGASLVGRAAAAAARRADDRARPPQPHRALGRHPRPRRRRHRRPADHAVPRRGRPARRAHRDRRPRARSSPTAARPSSRPGPGATSSRSTPATPPT